MFLLFFFSTWVVSISFLYTARHRRWFPWACKTETVRLIGVARFGSLEHELEQASDKLICITTIFRNLSVFESNHRALADPNVVRFLSGVIERLGTSKLLLRTNTNTLDFMNGIVIFLSNLSHSITLPSTDKALNLLRLILAFAPWVRV